MSRATASAAELAARLRARDVSAAPAVLTLLEAGGDAGRELLAELSPRALGGEAPGQIVGFTGPPGVGKSTLLGALVGLWRDGGRSVAVLAVDPSSKRSGGALLGDRIRIAGSAPGGPARFIRSMAAGERAGGLAPATRAAAQALAVAFDIVLVETVGVGQSETEVADLADTVVVVVQPGAGDSLQFLKSGLMEVPDVLVVAKADLGAPAFAALGEAKAALRLLGANATQTLAVSALAPTSGIAELVAALDAQWGALDLPARRVATRQAGALADFVSEYGQRGLRAVGGRRAAERLLSAQPADLDGAALVESLASAARASDF
ncbi:MAG: GTP-binding protein [Solirubrobacteraceae bacterium]